MHQAYVSSCEATPNSAISGYTASLVLASHTCAALRGVTACCMYCDWDEMSVLYRAGAYKVHPWITRMLGGDAGSRFDGWLLTVSSQVRCFPLATCLACQPGTLRDPKKGICICQQGSLLLPLSKFNHQRLLCPIRNSQASKVRRLMFRVQTALPKNCTALFCLHCTGMTVAQG